MPVEQTNVKSPAVSPIVPSSGGVESCTEADIRQVTELHSRVFYGTRERPSDRLQQYYRDVFFRNPWRDDELPSLVYRNGQGKVVGFIGVIARAMSFEGRPIRVAVAHRLMVAPDSGSPLAAVQLVRAFLSGPQDLAISDGANENGRKFWVGMGGSTAVLQSMTWLRPIRPFRFLAGFLRRGKPFAGITAISRPLCLLANFWPSGIWRAPLSGKTPGVEEVELDDGALLACTEALSEGKRLRPRYDIASLRWQMQRVAECQDRGQLKRFAIRGKGGRWLGACLYYLKSRGLAEVIYFAAMDNAADAVFRHLMLHAWRAGAAGLQGQADPAHMETYLRNDCFLKRGCWALVHSRNVALTDAILHGDAFLSALDGELWLYSPMARL